MKAEGFGAFVVVLSMLCSVTLSTSADDKSPKAGPKPPKPPEPPKCKSVDEFFEDKVRCLDPENMQASMDEHIKPEDTPCKCPKSSKCFGDFRDPAAEAHAGIRYKYKCESKEELDNFEKVKHSFDQGLYFPDEDTKALEELAKEEGEGVILE